MPTESQRHRLYQNALKLFYDKGFSATTMRDIASSMNFEAASLYNYFNSKEALLEELLFNVADQFLFGIQAIKASDQSYQEQLQSIIHLYVQITADNPYQAALLTSEWRNLNASNRQRFLDHRGQFEAHLKDILLAFFKEKKIHSIDINIAMHTFLGSTRWIYDWYIKHQGEINPCELENQLHNIILNGFISTKP